MTVHEKRIASNLYALQGRRTDQEMAWMIGAKGRGTWIDRKNNPIHLSIGEIELLSQKLKTPVETIIFGHIERN